MVTGRELSQGVSYLHSSYHQAPGLRTSLAVTVGPEMLVLRNVIKYYTSNWQLSAHIQ